MYLKAIGTTLPEAYHQALFSLYTFGDITDCKAWGCRQKDIAMTIAVLGPLAEPRISKLYPGGPDDLEQYRQEMLDGILDFEVDKGNWAYTYHQRMGKQIDFVINELKNDPSSRRAVINIRTPEDIGSDDPACLQHIQYFIRGGRLECYVLFRSNDAVKAAFMNMFALICLQERIANELGVPMGAYIHTANSFHCYERDFDTLGKYVLDYLKYNKDNDKLTYNYKGFYDELMEEAKPKIAEKVKLLKEK